MIMCRRHWEGKELQWRMSTKVTLANKKTQMNEYIEKGTSQPMKHHSAECTSRKHSSRNMASRMDAQVVGTLKEIGRLLTGKHAASGG